MLKWFATHSTQFGPYRMVVRQEPTGRWSWTVTTSTTEGGVTFLKRVAWGDTETEAGAIAAAEHAARGLCERRPS